MKHFRTTPDFPAWSHRLGPMKARLLTTGLRLRRATLSQLETRLGNCLPGRLLAKPAAGSHSRDRIYSLSRTFWGWLWQMLNHNASCREVVRQVQALCALQGGPAVDEDTGGYCQARAHLPQPLLEKALLASARTAMQRAPALSLLGGRPLKVVDGSSLRLPDTPANQKRFPQPANQKRGCGFPVMKLVVRFCLTSGVLLARAPGTLWESEARLLHRLLATLQPGDIVVGDRGFGNFVILALRVQRPAPRPLVECGGLGGPAGADGSAYPAHTGATAGLSLTGDHAGHHVAGRPALSCGGTAGRRRAALAIGTVPGRFENHARVGNPQVPLPRDGGKGTVGGVDRAQPAPVRDGRGGTDS